MNVGHKEKKEGKKLKKKDNIWYKAVVSRLLRQVEALMGHVVSVIHKSNRWRHMESERELRVTEIEKDLREMGFKLIDKMIFGPTGINHVPHSTYKHVQYMENTAGRSLVNLSQSVPKHSMGK